MCYKSGGHLIDVVPHVILWLAITMRIDALSTLVVTHVQPELLTEQPVKRGVLRLARSACRTPSFSVVHKSAGCLIVSALHLVLMKKC